MRSDDDMIPEAMRPTATRAREIALASVTILLCFLTLMTSVVVAPVASAQPTYSLDTDPLRLGRKALEEDRLEDAEVAFRRAVADGHRVAEATFGLARVALRQGQTLEGEQLLHEALDIRLSQNGKDYPEARAELAVRYLRRGRSEEASRELDRAAAEDPDLWNVRYGRAWIHIAAGEWESAEKLLAHGAALRGIEAGEDRYHHGMALLALARGDLGAAEREALIALAVNGADPELAALVGRVYERQGTPALALNAYEQALASTTGAARAGLLHAMARLHESMARYNEARDRYLDALAADSTYAPALHDLADLFRRANQPEQAARAYARYLELEPADLEALLAFIDASLEIRQIGAALEAARKALALDSTRVEAQLAFVRAGLPSRDPAVRSEAAWRYESLPDTVAWTSEDHVRAAAYFTEQEEPDRARAALERALRLDPRNAGALFRLGLLELKAGRPDSAVVRFEAAAELDTISAAYRYNLAVALVRAKRPREAIAPLRSAIALADSLIDARLLLGQILAASDSIDAAEEQYRAVLAAEPQNPGALRGAAFCAVQRGRFEEAVKLYRASVDVDPGNADGWAGLGSAYLGLEDWEAAGRAFEKAGAIDPKNATYQRGLELLKQARNP